MADRKPLKVLPNSASGTGGGDSTGIGEFVAADTLGVVDGGTGLATVATSNILTGNGTSALSAESNLTFTGSLLAVTGEVNIGSEPTAAASSADDLVVSTTGHTGITIFSGTSNEGILAFGDSADNDEGRLAFVHGDDYFKFIINDSEKMRIDSAGHVTTPSQPSFLARVADGGVSDVTGGGTPYYVVFGDVIYDQNSDMTSTTTFTAPVTGKYLIKTKLYLQGVTSAETSGNINIATSNRAYNYAFTPQDFSSGNVQFSVIADMDASDTSAIILTVSNGTDVIDLSGGTGEPRNFFCATLLC
jgi:hypothetical protein